MPLHGQRFVWLDRMRVRAVDPFRTFPLDVKGAREAQILSGLGCLIQIVRVGKFGYLLESWHLIHWLAAKLDIRVFDADHRALARLQRHKLGARLEAGRPDRIGKILLLFLEFY